MVMTPAPVKIRRPKGIPQEAVPVYRLAPSHEPDAFGWVAARLKARGWTLIEECYRIGEANAAGWIMVEGWAIPPERGE